MTDWRAEREADGELWCVKDAADALVFFGMDEARARLFAAAPYLLAAALHVIARYDAGKLDPRDVNALQDATDRARLTNSYTERGA